MAAKAKRLRSGRPAGKRARVRFGHRVEIVLKCYEVGCHGAPIKIVGNLSLREAGADATRLGFECQKCFQRVMVSDAWSPSTPEIDALHDKEP